MMVKNGKAHSFYDIFERKGPGQRATHYCPGCGHGNVHKLIAEAIDDFGVQDRVVFCSPVGCSVFGYYYFDTGNIQCAHGRAPAVATGIRRSLEDAIVISYQGDGDLAGIGMAEIVHAANRGENITVYFVNNAIYGMTGGQMAPTTIIGQKTLTSPGGRSVASEGNPIGMAELINSLATPTYVERVSLADGPRTLRARRAIRKALKNQIEGRGFSFVEILSPCPVNWKMSAVDARTWIIDALEPVFPVRNFRDRSTEASDSGTGNGAGTAGANGSGPAAGPTAEPTAQPTAEPTPPNGAAGNGASTREFADHDLLAMLSTNREITVATRADLEHDQLVRIAGFGGQGVLSAGILLANCGTVEGLHATWLPSYGPEMRGGTANAGVILSQQVIGSPLVDVPNVLMCLNGPSLDAFENTVAPGGLILVNSTVASRAVSRSDVRVCRIPASDIARETGFLGAANVVLLTVYALITGVPALETMRAVIPQSLKRKELVELNLRTMDAAIAWFHAHPDGETNNG